MSAVPQRDVVAPSGLTRWLPRLITALGVVHLVYAWAEPPGVIGDMVRDGVVGAADSPRGLPPHPDSTSIGGYR